MKKTAVIALFSLFLSFLVLPIEKIFNIPLVSAQSCSVPSKPQWYGLGIERVRTDLPSSLDKVTFSWVKDLDVAYSTLEFSYDGVTWIPLTNPVNRRLAQIPPNSLESYNQISLHIQPTVTLYIKIFSWNDCGQSEYLSGMSTPLDIPIVTPTEIPTPTPTETPVPTATLTPTLTPSPTPVLPAEPSSTPTSTPTPKTTFLVLPPINWVRPVLPSVNSSNSTTNTNPEPTIVVSTPPDFSSLRFNRPSHR